MAHRSAIPQNSVDHLPVITPPALTHTRLGQQRLDHRPRFGQRLNQDDGIVVKGGRVVRHG
jgi:hypothetical protein